MSFRTHLLDMDVDVDHADGLSINCQFLNCGPSDQYCKPLHVGEIRMKCSIFLVIHFQPYLSPRIQLIGADTVSNMSNLNLPKLVCGCSEFATCLPELRISSSSSSLI